MGPLDYDQLVLGLGGEVILRHPGCRQTRLPDVHLADAVRLRSTSSRWEAADSDPALSTRRTERVVVGGARRGSRPPARLVELYRTTSRRTSLAASEKARVILVEAGPDLLTMFKGGSARTRRARSRSGGSRSGSARPRCRSGHPRHLEVGTVLAAHTLVWGAGLQAEPVATSSGSRSSGEPGAVSPDLSLPEAPRGVRRWATSLGSGRKRKKVLPQLGSVALQAGEFAGRTSHGASAGSTRSPSATRTRAPWPRSAWSRRHPDAARSHNERERPHFPAWGAAPTSPPCRPARTGPRSFINWTWAGDHARAPGPDHGANGRGGRCLTRREGERDDTTAAPALETMASRDAARPGTSAAFGITDDLAKVMRSAGGTGSDAATV